MPVIVMRMVSGGMLVQMHPKRVGNTSEGGGQRGVLGVVKIVEGRYPQISAEIEGSTLQSVYSYRVIIDPLA